MLERQKLVNGGGVIAVTFEVAVHDAFQGLLFDVWTRQCTRVEQYLANISGKRITIPDAEVVELVPAEEEPLQAKSREGVIGAGNPLRHPVIVRVFRFEGELLVFVAQ